MGLFKKKQKAPPVKAPLVGEKPPVFTNLLPGRNYEGLANDDAELRVWLPEVCRAALEEVTNALDVTEAFWLRATFLMHLYGEHEYRRMFAQKTDFFAPPRKVSRKSSRYAVSFSVVPPDPDKPLPEPTTWVAPSLGKSMWPIKVFVPKQLKEDLQHAASKAGVTLAIYVRELLLARLLGHAFDCSSTLHGSIEPLNAGEAWESGAVDDRRVPIRVAPSSGSEIAYLND